MDVEQGHKELDNYEEKVIESNEAVKRLIVSVNSNHKEITIGTEKICIRPYMPKKIRAAAVKVGRQLQEATEETLPLIEEGIYPIVAAMCVDAPFTDEKVWVAVDSETGCIQDVLMRIIEEVNKVDESVKSFR